MSSLSSIINDFKIKYEDNGMYFSEQEMARKYLLMHDYTIRKYMSCHRYFCKDCSMELLLNKQDKIIIITIPKTMFPPVNTCKVVIEDKVLTLPSRCIYSDEDYLVKDIIC